VKSVITYEPTGQQIDLAGGVDAETFAWLESLQGACRRIEPILRCGGCKGSLYLRHHGSDRSQLHGVHHVQAACRTLVISKAAVMSDEHKREAEYHALAGEAAGLPADMEVVTTGRTRVDVVVSNTGFEVQRSAERTGVLQSRTRRSMAAGLEVVGWFTDWPSRPPWWAKVPSYTTRRRDWAQMPPLRTVPVIGPQEITPARCDGTFKCPEGKRRPCGGYHVKYEPWAMLLDDLVVRMATGDLLAAQVGKWVRLLSPAGMQLHQDLTGLWPAYTPGHPLAHKPVRSERVSCTRPIVAGWFAMPADCNQLQLALNLSTQPGDRTT
jgi:hypothetical protein